MSFLQYHKKKLSLIPLYFNTNSKKRVNLIAEFTKKTPKLHELCPLKHGHLFGKIRQFFYLCFLVFSKIYYKHSLSLLLKLK